jgi:hypothetical protein
VFSLLHTIQLLDIRLYQPPDTAYIRQRWGLRTLDNPGALRNVLAEPENWVLATAFHVPTVRGGIMPMTFDATFSARRPGAFNS